MTVRQWWDQLYEALPGLKTAAKASSLFGLNLSKPLASKALSKLLPGGLTAKRMARGGARGHFVRLPAYEACCSHLETMYGFTLERAADPGQRETPF